MRALALSPDAAWAIGLCVMLVLTAALINAVAPQDRVRVRRCVMLFVAYLVTVLFAQVFAAAELLTWAERADLLALLLRSYTLVSLGATVLLALLPRSGVALPMIASDLLVGFAYVFTTLGVLASRGLNPTGALASAAVVSAVLAISLQSTLGNVLGGIALQLDGSVHEGDWIEFPDGQQGIVRAIRWRHTVVETRDFSTIIVPNATLLANNIRLLGKRNGERVPQRVAIRFNVDFRYPPTRVVDVLNTAFEQCVIEGVASDPTPNCVCIDLAREPRGSYASYALRFWLLDMSQLEPTSSRVRARIYTALAREDIQFAVPAETLRVQRDDKSELRRKRLKAQCAAMRAVPLFAELTDEELAQLAPGLRRALYTSNEVITREGAVAHWLYLLTQGSVEVRKPLDREANPNGPYNVLATIRAPNLFGEMGMLTGEPRTADVVAIDDVECYRLDRETFQRVLAARPELASALSANVAERRMALETHASDADANTRMQKEREQVLERIKGFFGL